MKRPVKSMRQSAQLRAGKEVPLTNPQKISRWQIHSQNEILGDLGQEFSSALRG